MDEWTCVVVWNFRALFQLPPVTKESASTLNRVDVWFLIVTIFKFLLSLSQNLFVSHSFDLRFCFFIRLLHFSRYSFLIMSSFLSGSAIGISNPWWTERSSSSAVPPQRRLVMGILTTNPLPQIGQGFHVVLVEALLASVGGHTLLLLFRLGNLCRSP